MVFIRKGPNKVKPDYGIKDIYKYYVDNSEDPLDYKMFKTVWSSVAEIIVKLIVFKNIDFMLPARLGSLYIRKIKSKPIINSDGSVSKNRLSVDYKASWIKWTRQYPDLSVKEIAKLKDKKPVYHLNENTDGFRVKWIWDKFTCTVKNQSIYSLAITRTNKQILSKAFKNHNTDYYEQDRK